ncbi:MAG: elongation factor Ts, partial [Candidatus Bipolaricaulaceae bacterium]
LNLAEAERSIVFIPLAQAQTLYNLRGQVTEVSIFLRNIDQEKEILRKQAEREGKPPHIVEKIVEGRLQKFFEENCLLKQPYVRDPSLRVEDVVGELAAKLGEPVVIRRFVRFQVGEG